MADGPDRFIVCCMHDPTETDVFLFNCRDKNYYSAFWTAFISHLFQQDSSVQFQALLPNEEELHG